MCALFGKREEINLDTINCSDGSHFHFTRSEALARIKANEAEWIIAPVSRGDRGVMRFIKNASGFRGLSCKVGATLAIAVQRGEKWAAAMLEDIAA